MQIKAYFALGTKVFAKARVTVFYSASYNFKEKEIVKECCAFYKSHYINSLITLTKTLMIREIQSPMPLFSYVRVLYITPNSPNSMPH